MADKTSNLTLSITTIKHFGQVNFYSFFSLITFYSIINIVYIYLISIYFFIYAFKISLIEVLRYRSYLIKNYVQSVFNDIIISSLGKLTSVYHQQPHKPSPQTSSNNSSNYSTNQMQKLAWDGI